MALCILASKNVRPISPNQVEGVACEPARASLRGVVFMQVIEEGVASVPASRQKGDVLASPHERSMVSKPVSFSIGGVASVYLSGLMIEVWP